MWSIALPFLVKKGEITSVLREIRPTRIKKGKSETKEFGREVENQLEELWA